MAGKTYSGTYTSTIVLTDTSRDPVKLKGSITVNGTNAASDSGFYSNVAFAWSITNLGNITAHGATSYGIALLDGGTIQNGTAKGASGVIVSDETGIFITGAAAAVTNDSTIIGTYGRGVFLQDGGTIDNAVAGATITGGFEGVAIYNAGGSLSNAGTILDTGASGLAAELYAGVVNNLAGGVIAGVYGVGFVGRSAAGTLTNAGVITGTARDGVELSGGGSVTNSGSIFGAIGGVLALYGTSSVLNTGSISGLYAGLDLLAGGSVTNQAGGRITGGFGVSLGNGMAATGPGTVVNAGVISGGTFEGVSMNEGGTLNNSGSIYGAAAGVAAFYGAEVVTNTGSISGGIGVSLGAGGGISNAAGASIAGVYGVVIGNGAPSGAAAAGASLSNAGVISGTGNIGVELLTSGDFVNQAGGTISGGNYGIYVQSVAGTIANYGLISGQTGVYGRAVVANGTRYPGQVTIINAGTITGTGGKAVSMFSSNDLLIVRPGAVFNGGVVGGGGRLELGPGGAGVIGTLSSALASFSSVTIDAGADWTLAGTISAGDTLFAAGQGDVKGGATLSVRGVVSGGAQGGTLTTSHNGVISVSGTILSNVTIDFNGPAGHLALTSALTDFAPTVGFSAGDTIYLPNIALAGLTESYSGSPSGGTLTLSQSGAVVGRVNLLGSYTTGSFALTSDPNGGSDVVIPCFAAGTRIGVEDGERRVERLRVGMRVLTGSGALRPIVWIGRRRVDVAAHDDPRSVRPVRIAAGAFGPGQPRRPLLLSPDHAVWFEGALIPAHLLVNDRSVTLGPVGVVRYFHVELDRHDVLLAEGLTVESYLDTGNRGLLGGTAAAPDRVQPPCAPLCLSGPMVARARRHVLVRAWRAGMPGPAPAHVPPPPAITALGRVRR